MMKKRTRVGEAQHSHGCETAVFGTLLQMDFKTYVAFCRLEIVCQIYFMCLLQCYAPMRNESHTHIERNERFILFIRI